MNWYKVVVCPCCGTMKVIFTARNKWKCSSCKAKHLTKETEWEVTKKIGEHNG